jgi:hypothetical protein
MFSKTQHATIPNKNNNDKQAHNERFAEYENATKGTLQMT